MVVDALQTTASGSPITASDYLLQSPRVPFTAGRVLELPGGILYGYSGLVDFDVTRASEYNLLTFQLERDAVFKMAFNCSWDVLDVSNDAVGVQVAIDGVDIIHSTWPGSHEATRTDPFTITYIVPANRGVEIVVLNPDGGADLLSANVTLVGRYL